MWQKVEISNDRHITWCSSLALGYQQFQVNDVAYFTTLNLNFCNGVRESQKLSVTIHISQAIMKTRKTKYRAAMLVI